MTCPSCNGAMQPGSVQVRSSWVSFFLAGFGLQELMFDSQGEARSMLPTGEQRPAHACPTCGAVFIEPRPEIVRDHVDPKTGVVTAHVD